MFLLCVWTQNILYVIVAIVGLLCVVFCQKLTHFALVLTRDS